MPDTKEGGVKVGHSAQLAAKCCAEWKNGKIFNFFQFLKNVIFSIFNQFFIKNILLWDVLEEVKNDYFSGC